MKRLSRFFILLAPLLFLAACTSSPESRIAQNRFAFNSYPSEVQELIRKGHVAVGMTQDQVEMSLGSPLSIGGNIRSNYGISFTCTYWIRIKDPEGNKLTKKKASVLYHNGTAIRITLLD